MFVSSLRFFFLALGFAVVVLQVSAQDKKEKTIVVSKTGELVAGTEEEEGKGLEIGKLLPLNKPNLRVKIPGYENGQLTSMVEAEKLTRVDDENLELEDATIQLITQELSIKLRTALYNTPRSILSSNETTTISSKQFTMTGASLDFDTKTGKGQMIGKTRMVIHNLSSMGGKSAPAEATSTEGASKQEETKK